MTELTVQPKIVPAATCARSNETSYKWWVVFMLWFLCFFNYADRQSIYAIFPALQHEFGFDKFQLGLIGSAFSWVYAFSAPAAGFIADRLCRKKLILGGCILWSLVTVLTGWCGTLGLFIIVRALEGLGETFYFPAAMSLMSDYHGPRTRSRAMSFHQSSVYLGTILGSWFGALLAEHYNWRYGFYLFGCIGLLLACIFFKFLKEPVRGQSDHAVYEREKKVPLAMAVKMLCTHWPPILLMMTFFIANLVSMMFFAWTPTFLIEKFHFQMGTAGLFATVYIFLASAISVPLAGTLADHLVRRRIVSGRILIQAFGLLGASGLVIVIGNATNILLLISAMIALGISKGFYEAGIFASLYDVIDPRARATAAGIMNTVGWAGGALGPLLTGWYTMHGRQASQIENMSAAIGFGGYIYFAGAVLLFIAAAALTRSVCEQEKLCPSR